VLTNLFLRSVFSVTILEFCIISSMGVVDEYFAGIRVFGWGRQRYSRRLPTKQKVKRLY